MNNYIDELKQAIAFSNLSDGQAYYDYVMEMIQDMQEMGMDDQAIISKLGPVDQLIADYNASYPVSHGKPLTKGTLHTFNNNSIKEINVDLTSMHLTIKESEDLTYSIVYDNPEIVELSCHNDSLDIENSNNLKNINKNINVTLFIPKYNLLDEVNIDSVHGHIDIDNFENAKAEFNIDTVSGYVQLNTVTVNELNCDSISANITLSNTKANEINLDSVSGTINAALLDSDNLNIDTVSGNINLKMAKSQTNYALSIDAIRHSQEVNRGASKKIDVDTASGKVDVTFNN